MRYRIEKGRISNGGGHIYGPGEVIDLTPEQAASLTERGCALAPIVDSPPPAGQAEAPAEPEAGDSGAGDDSPEPAPEPAPKPRTRRSRRGA